MNKQIGKWLLGMALTGVVLVSTAGWAKGPAGGMEHDPARMMEHMSSKLDLSEQQQAEVKKLLASARKETAADQQRMQELRKEMRAQSDSFVPEKARKIADEIGQITGRLVYQAAETHAGFYQLLNAEQQAAMAGMMAKRESHRDKWRKGAGE